MPYALQLYFDPVTDATVRNLWRRTRPQHHVGAVVVPLPALLVLLSSRRPIGRFVEGES